MSLRSTNRLLNLQLSTSSCSTKRPQPYSQIIVLKRLVRDKHSSLFFPLRRRRRKNGFMGSTPEQRRPRCPPSSRPMWRKDHLNIPTRVIYKGTLVYFMLYTVVSVGKGSI
jgi:hypothetical protein